MSVRWWIYPCSSHVPFALPWASLKKSGPYLLDPIQVRPEAYTLADTQLSQIHLPECYQHSLEKRLSQSIDCRLYPRHHVSNHSKEWTEHPSQPVKGFHALVGNVPAFQKAAAVMGMVV